MHDKSARGRIQSQDGGLTAQGSGIILFGHEVQTGQELRGNLDPVIPRSLSPLTTNDPNFRDSQAEEASLDESMATSEPSHSSDSSRSLSE